ncbi:MAG TPA: endoglucanase [Prevotella sp.]|nr:endoglucanase [Prevotella sp.]
MIRKSFLYNTIILLWAVSALFLSSCDNDHVISGDGVGTEFTVSKDSMVFTDNGGSTTLAVRAAKEPAITSSADWLTVAVAEKGNNVYNYVITATTYTASSEKDYNNRTAVLTISDGVSSQAVAVTQTPQYGIIIDDPSTKVADIGADSTTAIISLRANGAYAVLSDVDWISVTNGTRGLTASKVTATVNKNVSDARSGKISFTLGKVTESVTFSQSEGYTPSDMGKTAQQLTKFMYPGWNLGNTMEAGSSSNLWTDNGGVGAEFLWQPTATTQALIDAVKAQGFKSIRIPCAWAMGHITDMTGYTIDKAWMNRVQEIVDYCIKDGLYVIINDHYDGGWLEDDGFISSADVKNKTAQLTLIWTQIANKFKKYGDHLIFAGLNEPAKNDNLSVNSYIANLYAYEQAFINAVRATGGNNAQRVLAVQGPETNIDKTVENWDPAKLKDTATGKLIVEVHFYDPWQFTGLTADASWGNMWYYWGDGNNGDSNRTADKYEESYISDQMIKMKTTFGDKGYGVIIGEYGANQRFSIGTDAIHDASIKAYYTTVNKYAIDNGCVPFAWDTNTLTYPCMTILKRVNTSIFNSNMMEGIMSGVAAAVWPY